MMMVVVFSMETNGVIRERFCMELWASKWFHGNVTFMQLFNKDVETMNKVNPNIFSFLV
jgi:hypothetical protein